MLRTLARRASPLATARCAAPHAPATATAAPRWQQHISQARQPKRMDGGSFCQAWRQLSTTGSQSDYSAERGSEGEGAEEIERLPLPPGISGDKFGLYELPGTAKDMGELRGDPAVLSVHGPEELWTPVEGNAGAAGGVFAVIAAGGTQHKVSPDDVLYVNRITGEVNERVRFEDVLLVGAYDWTVWGRPLIATASVVGTVEEQTATGKVMVTKFKKRKGYQRRKGHRQPITRVRIEEVRFEWPDGGITPYEVKLDPRRPPQPNHKGSFF